MYRIANREIRNALSARCKPGNNRVPAVTLRSNTANTEIQKSRNPRNPKSTKPRHFIIYYYTIQFQQYTITE